ncbi:MAG: arsenate reductase (glutaredoxin) [Cryomorphaceae bacterium]|nr:MAG: arsenate reductase (glutaredoxin) [Cryomorphaceae bacterium]
MSEIEIYHNPRCRKSREALEILKEAGHEPAIRLYLDETPDVDTFKKLLARLNMRPEALLRKGEAVYKEKFRGKDFNDDEWIDIMLENPKLIERPIVIRGNKAVVGRPPERVKEIL